MYITKTMQYSEAIRLKNPDSDSNFDKLREKLLTLVANIDFYQKIAKQSFEKEINRLTDLNYELKALFTLEEFDLIIKALHFNLEHIKSTNLETLGSEPIVTSSAVGKNKDGVTVEIVGKNSSLKTASPTGTCAETAMCNMSKSLFIDSPSIKTIVVTSFSKTEHKLFQCCPGCREYLTNMYSPDTKIIFINHEDGLINLAGNHSIAEIDSQNAAISYLESEQQSKDGITKAFHTAITTIPTLNLKSFSPKPPNLVSAVILYATKNQVLGLDSIFEISPGVYMLCIPTEVSKGTKRTPSAATATLNVSRQLIKNQPPLGVLSMLEHPQGTWQVVPPDGVLASDLQTMFENGVHPDIHIATNINGRVIVMPFSKYYLWPEANVCYNLNSPLS